MPGIFVLGVSSSGTSVVMSVLHALGAHLGGAERVGRSDAHPDGINELPAAVALDKAIYAAHGLKWEDTPRLLPPSHPELVGKARQVLLELSRGAPPGRPWALKDPRLVVTLGYWSRAADLLNSSYSLVLTAREPLANAASLCKHGRFKQPLRRWA